jgi:hypothetical protein
VEGVSFVPLGGTNDGGADAYLSSVRRDAEPGVFYQASVQVDYASKISRTVKRLKEVGREVVQLVYLTSRRIARTDAEERRLTKATGVSVKIRDGAYLLANLNTSDRTRAAFQSHLAHHLEPLKRLGASEVVGVSSHVKSPAVFVFLRQELDRRAGSQALSESIVDSLAMWALEETDPDQNKFLTREQISAKILEVLPFARVLLRKHLEKRLTHLSSKANATGREIRWHKKDDHYCLPFETRLQIRDENAKEEGLRLRVLSTFASRISTTPDQIDAQTALRVAEYALKTVQRTFEKEGIEFSSFLAGKDQAHDSASMEDTVEKILAEEKVKAPTAQIFKDAILAALRAAFYDSTPDERLLFGKLSRTYSLLFGMQADAKVVTFFQDMSRNFQLYVGTDLLVRALSERYVRPEDQRVRTLLRMLAEGGAQLILAEPVLDEVLSHLRNTDREFQSSFAPTEAAITYEIARNCDRILIRAYFYARLTPTPGTASPTSWNGYLNQFVTPANLGRPHGKEELRNFLLSQFKMKFEARADLDKAFTTDERKAELRALADQLAKHKSHRHLAENDALMALTVLHKRQARGERAKANVFGFSTWWLTSEASIVQYARALVRAHGSRYMMRPEFVLNFIAFAPQLAEVRRAYESVFPSLLGVQLGNRVREEVFRDMLAKVQEANQLEPGRRESLIASYSDELKSNFRREYEHAVVEDED